MTKPMVRIYTDAENFIDREMNAKEFSQYQADVEIEKAKIAEAETASTAKAALLDRLGLTADEAKLLLS